MDIAEINKLIKQFDETRKMMKAFTTGNMKNMMNKMPGRR
jgi:signal recognition particle GTPase